MSEKKTKITHSQDKARFLGYDITTAKNSALMQSSGHTEMPIQAVGQEQPVPDDKGASGNMDYTEEDVKKYQMDPDINELLDFSFCGEWQQKCVEVELVAVKDSKYFGDVIPISRNRGR